MNSPFLILIGICFTVGVVVSSLSVDKVDCTVAQPSIKKDIPTNESVGSEQDNLEDLLNYNSTIY